MNYTVAFSPEAVAHLDALEDCISNTGSTSVAARFIDNLIGYCESLALFPLRGTCRADLLPALRVTHYRRTTLIAFMADPETETVTILGVFHGGQDYGEPLQDNET